jgi:MarR family transcriptional regulator, 2-MHQ and catechol-resistance regulon repressor
MNNDLKTLTILFRTLHRFETYIKEDVQRYGLNPTEFGVLEVLYHKGALTIQAIKEKVLIASSSMSYVVEKLIEKGYIERKQDPIDKRFATLNLNEQGTQLMKRIYPLHVKQLRQRLDRLSSEEEQTLRMLLKKIGKD